MCGMAEFTEVACSAMHRRCGLFTSTIVLLDRISRNKLGDDEVSLSKRQNPLHPEIKLGPPRYQLITCLAATEGDRILKLTI
jgi:hypothetical protein